MKPHFHAIAALSCLLLPAVLPAASAADLAAVADGKADATAALQSIIDMEGVLVLGPGTYRLTGPLNVGSGQGIVGPGTLLVDFDAGLPEGSTGTSASDTAIILNGEGMKLEGFTLKKIFMDGSYGIGIVGEPGSKNIRISALDISGYSARYGIHLVEVEDFSISDCYIHDFMMNAGADMIADSPAGLRITRSRRGVISGNRIVRIESGPEGRKSISPLRPNYGPQRYQSDNMSVFESQLVAINGNTLETSGEAIDVLLSTQCTVANNTIRDIWFQGVKMLGVDSSSVTGNVLVDCHQGVGLADHTSVGKPCRYNTVVGNTIRFTDEPTSFDTPDTERYSIGQTRCGVFMDNDCDYNLVANNVISDDRAEAYITVGIDKNDGEHNRYDGNLVYIRATEKDETEAVQN